MSDTTGGLSEAEQGKVRGLPVPDAIDGSDLLSESLPGEASTDVTIIAHPRVRQFAPEGRPARLLRLR